MINFDFDNQCCGCFACADSCPKQCISQIKDKHGFLIPSVDKSLCIDCHKCEKVCPILKTEKQSYPERKVFSAYNKDSKIRNLGSSGSVFHAVASNIIALGGIVYGAAFQNGFTLKHSSASTLEELSPLMKSKYLQSNTLGVYNSVKLQLNKGRFVLFVGTPCQCNALYKFLGSRKPENLFIIDFICHGVPSQELFDNAIAAYEAKHLCHVEEFSFRHKLPDNTHYYILKSTGQDNQSSVHHGFFEEFPFYYGFKKYCCLRESCYKCKFCVEDRVSDITIADFWQLDKIDKSISKTDFNKGYSMVITNSARGDEIIKNISSSLELQQREIGDISAINHAYSKPTKKGVYARRFWRDYEKMTYQELEQKHLVFIPFKQLPFLRKICRYLIYKLHL